MRGNPNVAPPAWLPWCLAFAVALTSVACQFIPNNGPTAVSRSELYESSEPEYDAFFELLHDVQGKVAATNNEPRELNRTLAVALGLDEFASKKLVSERFAKTLEELAKHDSKLTIELIGLEEGATETDAIVTLTDASGNPKTTELSRTLSQVSRRLVKLLIQLRALERSLEALRTKLPKLEAQVDERFRLLGPARTRETKRNLADTHVALQSLRVQVESSDEATQALFELIETAKPVDEAPGKPPGGDPKGETGAKPKH